MARAAAKSRVNHKKPPSHTKAPPSLPQLQLFDVASVRRYERNARTHPAEQVEKLAALIQRHGWTNSAFVDVSRDNLLCFGHGRLSALELLWSRGQQVRMFNGALIPPGKLPAFDCTGWTEEQLREVILADNRSALDAGWDADLLRGELLWLQDQGSDLLWTGFDADELAVWMAPPGTDGLTDPDNAPEKQDKAVSKLGDIWLLGGHRLGCGDSTKAEAVTALLGRDKPFLMVTDPPYGVEYDPTWRMKAGIGSKGAAKGKVANDDRADWREAWALFPGSVAYVWHGGLHAAVVAESLMACKLLIRSQIVWVKTRPVIGRGAYHWQHEPAFYAVKQGKDDRLSFESDHELAAYAVRDGSKAGWEGDRKQSTVWMIEHLKNDTGHGTQKPVECMRRPIVNNSAPGAAVYDPFSGSGTTIIAAEMTGRRALALELDPLYVDVAVRRWQAFTGKTATLADGRSFADVEAGGAKRGR